METINQTESDLENKILLIIKNTQHLQDCTKSALDAIAFRLSRRDAHWRYNEYSASLFRVLLFGAKPAFQYTPSLLLTLFFGHKTFSAKNRMECKRFPLLSGLC
jgi:hypothetical protein